MKVVILGQVGCSQGVGLSGIGVDVWVGVGEGWQGQVGGVDVQDCWECFQWVFEVLGVVDLGYEQVVCQVRCVVVVEGVGGVCQLLFDDGQVGGDLVLVLVVYGVLFLVEVVFQVVQYLQVVEWVDVVVDVLCQCLYLGVCDWVVWQQWWFGMGFVEVFEDGYGLVQLVVIVEYQGWYEV